MAEVPEASSTAPEIGAHPPSGDAVERGPVLCARAGWPVHVAVRTLC